MIRLGWSSKSKRLPPPSSAERSSSVQVTVLSHAAMDAQCSGGDVPDRPERLKAVSVALRASGLPLSWGKAPRARRADLRLVHTYDHIASIFSAEPERGSARLDADTFISPGSVNAALRPQARSLKRFAVSLRAS